MPVVRRNSAKRCDRAVTELGALETTGSSSVFGQIALLEGSGSDVNDVSPLLHEAQVVFLIVSADAIQSWRLRHLHIPMGREIAVRIEVRSEPRAKDLQVLVPKPLYDLMVTNRPEHDLRIQIIRQLRHELALDRQLLVRR